MDVSNELLKSALRETDALAGLDEIIGADLKQDNVRGDC